LAFRWIAAAIFGCCSALLLSGLAPKEAAAEADWTVIFSGEMKGKLEPCGCDSPQMGGLSRRATLIRKRLQDPRLVPVENGDLIDVVSRQSELKLTVQLAYFQALKYAAVNLGAKDLAMGIPLLQTLSKSYKVPLLCGNLLDENGNHPFPEYTLREDGKGNFLMVIGVLSPAKVQLVEAACPGYSLGPVEPALDRAKSALPEGAPSILLYQGELEEAKAIAKKAPWLKLIVYSDAGGSWKEPLAVQGVQLVYAGDRGRAVGEAKIGATVTVARHNLGPEFANDKQTAAIRDMYIEAVRDGGFMAEFPRQPLPESTKYVGSKLCGECHDDAYQVWKKSKHAHAYKTLEDVKHDADPDCVYCHVVGMKYIGGFVSAKETPDLKDVGCESCHGPGSKHVADYTVSMKTEGEKNCITCHDAENSPRFDFQKYWKQIEH